MAQRFPRGITDGISTGVASLRQPISHPNREQALCSNHCMTRPVQMPTPHTTPNAFRRSTKEGFMRLLSDVRDTRAVLRNRLPKSNVQRIKARSISSAQSMRRGNEDMPSIWGSIETRPVHKPRYINLARDTHSPLEMIPEQKKKVIPSRFDATRNLRSLVLKKPKEKEDFDDEDDYYYDNDGRESPHEEKEEDSPPVLYLTEEERARWCQQPEKKVSNHKSGIQPGFSPRRRPDNKSDHMITSVAPPWGTSSAPTVYKVKCHNEPRLSTSFLPPVNASSPSGYTHS